MNVVVVDDERIILAVETAQVKKVLPEANVESFSFAEDALEYAKNNPVDIAFLDINLEETTGIELTKKLQSLNPRMNIIFCTGYAEYALEALNLYSSGYLLKPVTEEKLRKALDNLRYPVQSEKSPVRVQCFGDFEVFYNGEPLKFKYGKTKELFAYLVDRKGAMVSNNEAMITLFDEEKTSYLRNLRSDVINTFQNVGVPDAILQSRGELGVRMEKLDCDYYDYLNGQKELFTGEYMTQYSFAEDTLAGLLQQK